jgi:hypothetical protein
MEGWIMTDIRTSKLGGGATPYGTSTQRDTLIPSPEVGQTFYNGTLGVQEIYTSSGWLPATGANDFNVTLDGSVTTATFTKEYFAGAYTINSALLDNTYDIYVYNTAGNQVGYTKSPSLNATGNFNKIVIIGGSTGDLISFSYKTTFTATNTTSQVTAGAFITSATPTALNSIDDTTTIVGGNFSSNVAVYFVGSDNVERAAKSIVRSSDSQLIVTRPDNFPTTLGTYKLVVENPGITRPTGSSFHILNNAITAGTTPNWTTATTLPEVAKDIPYSTTLIATDSEGTDIDYSIVSGSLPAGITLNNETGVLSGTYTGADFNTTNLVVRAIDTGGNTVDRTFTIFSSNPVLISSPSSFFYSGVGYSSSITASDNSSLIYSVFSGSLPAGLSLNSSTGLISGTPSNNTNTSATLRATDSVGNFVQTSVSFISDPVPTISNLWGRYDASNSNNYVLTSGAVSQWTDLSGNGRHLTQATSSRRPTVKVAEKNGLNVIYFDGGAKGLTTASLTLNNPITIFTVVKMYSLNSYTTIFDGVNNNEANLTGNSGSQIQLYTQGFVGGMGASTNTWYRLTHVMDAGSSFDRRNDTVTSTWSDGTVTMGGLRIGEGDGGGENGNMDIAEVIVYNRALSTSEINTVNSFLSSKWAI